MSSFSHRLEVRFRDCDAMGHTNNAVYLTYLEQARIAHWRALWGYGRPPALSERQRVEGSERQRVEGSERQRVEGPEMPGVILARVEADYKRPSRYGDVLDVRLTIAEIGRTSFRYEYEIVNEQGEIVLTAKTVQVMYDYTANRPVPIPDSIRALLAPDRSR